MLLIVSLFSVDHGITPLFKKLSWLIYEMHLFVTMLHLKEIEKNYNGKVIINVVDFTFSEGNHWIAGVNGSGKTTLLKILCGLLPFAGDAILKGTSLKRQPVAYRRLVSFAEAEPLYPSFITGIHLVKYYQEIRKASSENIDDLINFSGLRHQLANTVGTYSSGMVKRLSLLLAFIGHVPLILLDEPLSTLDAEAVHTLPGLINNYRRKYGTSFILSSHQALPDALQIDSKYLINNQTISSINA